MVASYRWKLLSVLILLIVVLGGVGGYITLYPRQGSSTVKTNSSTTVAASAQTTTSSTIQSTTQQLYKLSGQLFFDKNGNGKQDSREPPLPNVTIALDGRNVTSTNSTGWYMIKNVTGGGWGHTIHPFLPKNFRYISLSVYDYKPVNANMLFYVNNDTRKDFGAMVGYLTLPFMKNATEYQSRVYVDLGKGTAYIRDWQGGTDTYHGHTGTDFFVPTDTKILAAAPGRVLYVFYNTGGGNAIKILHPDGTLTSYYHLDKQLVREGENVYRGQVIGLSDRTGTNAGQYPHLHFNLQTAPYTAGTGYIDPYRDLHNPSSICYWTVDDDPQNPF